MSDIQFGLRLTADASSLSGGVQQGRQQVTGLSGDVKTLKQRIDELQGTAAGLKGQLSAAFDPNAAAYLQKSLASVNSELARTQQALSATTSVKRGFEDIAQSAEKSAFSTARARSEIIVIGHEALTGNFSRIPGSLMVLTERMGGLGASMGPVILGLVGVGVAGAALLTVVSRAEQAERVMNTLAARFDATGRTSLATRDQVAQLVTKLTELSGVDKAAGQAIVGSFASAYNIGAPMVKQLIGLVGDFATATGMKAPEAAKALAAAFQDPTHGAEELQKALGTLSIEQQLQIERAQRLGDMAGAQRILFDALTTSVQGLHNQALTPLQKSTQELTRAWDDLTGAVAQSDAWRTVTGFVGGLIDKFAWIIDHRNQIKEALTPPGVGALDNALSGTTGLTPAPIVGLQLAQRFLGAVTAKPPHVAGDFADNTGASVTEANALEFQSRSLLKTAAGYHSVGEETRKAAEDARAFEAILGKLREAGQQNTETYRRFADALQGARERMAKKTGDFDNSVFLQGIRQQEQAVLASLNDEQAQRRASYQQQLADIEAFHAAGLIGEQAYRTAKAAALKAELQDEIANVDAALNKEAGLLAALYSHNAGSREQQKADDEAKARSEKAFDDLTSKRVVLVTQLDTAQQAANNAEMVALGKQQAQIRSLDADYEKFLKSLDDEQKKRELTISLIGKTKEEQARANAEFAEETKLQAELNKLWVEFYDAAAKFDGAVMASTLSKINDLNARWGSTVKAAGDAVATEVRVTETLQNQLGVWNQLADAAGGFASALTRGVGSAFDYIRNLAKQFLADLVALFAKRWVLNLGASLLAGTNAGAALANQAAILGNGTIAGNVGSLLGMGSMAGTTMGTFGSAIGGADMGVGFGVAAQGGTGLAGALGLSSGAAAAIPYIGFGIAAAGLIASLFSGKGGGPKGGGSASLGDVSAISFGAGGGRYYTPSDADSSLGKVLDTEQSGFNATYASLGGKGHPNVGFALGYDTDPQGTANNRVSAGATVNGKSVYQYYSGDNALGRSDSVLQSTLTLEAKRTLLAALQASDLPQDVADILKGVDPGTATEKAIDNVLNLAKAVKTLADLKLPDDVYQRLKGTLGPAGENQQEALTFGQSYSIAHDTSLDDPRRLASHAIATSDAGAAGTLSNLLHGTADLMNSFDGTADAALGLANASVTLKQGLVDAMIQAEQTRKSIHDMFESTREKITLAGMPDNQARYNYFQADAEHQRQLLAQASDPAQIDRITQRINRDVNSAFDLMSPEEQQQHWQEFIDGLNQVETEASNKLSQYETSIQTTVDGMVKDIKDVIDGAMDKFIDGAGDVKDGGNKIASAANAVSAAAAALRSAVSDLAGALTPGSVNG